MPSRPPAMTLGRFLAREEAGHPSGAHGWIPVLAGLARAGKRIAREVAHTGLVGTLSPAGGRNVHGEAATRIDHFAHDAVVEEMPAGDMLCCIISEEAEHHLPLPTRAPGGGCILAVDPLDGSSNLGVNVRLGRSSLSCRARRPARRPIPAPASRSRASSSPGVASSPPATSSTGPPPCSSTRAGTACTASSSIP